MLKAWNKFFFPSAYSNQLAKITDISNALPISLVAFHFSKYNAKINLLTLCFS